MGGWIVVIEQGLGLVVGVAASNQFGEDFYGFLVAIDSFLGGSLSLTLSFLVPLNYGRFKEMLR